MDEKGSLLWRKAGLLRLWTKRFQLGLDELFRKTVDDSENVAAYGAYMDGWEAVQYYDGRQVYYLFGRNACN
jgi:hypothetical protein